MTTASAGALGLPARTAAAALTSIRRLAWRSPESWSLVLSGLASLILATRVWSAGADAVAGAGAHALHQASDASAVSLAAMADWSLMVLAMMVPLVAASVRMVAARSLWRRRHRAVIAFLSSYVLLWSVVGWATLAIVGRLVGSGGSSLPATAALLLAAIWQATTLKQRALMACHRTAPLAPHGWRATRDCVDYGLLAGLRCVASCWAMMMACALAHHSVLVMATASAVAWSERSTRISPRATSAALVACALLHALFSR